MTAPRIGIIGARRVRQGLGPFVAKYLHEAGAEVPCFLATSHESRAAAQHDLQNAAGIRAQGYTDLEAMLAEQTLDALAILSPAETHHAYLDAALAAGLHVLCEKPLVWGDLDMVATAHAIVAEFERRGLILWENCQWPYTLPAYRALYPESSSTVRRFDMRMSPSSIGPSIIADVMPHPLSLLQAIAPGADAQITGATFTRSATSDDEARLNFDYRAGSHRVGVHVQLTAVPTPPRMAAFGVDGRWVQRLLRMEDYAIFFSDGLRIVDVPDPMGLLIAEFVGLLKSDWDAKVYATVTRQWGEITQRIKMLHTLRSVVEERLA